VTQAAAWLRRLRAVGALLLILTISPGFAALAADLVSPGEESREILVMVRLAPDHFRPNASYGGDYGDGQSNKMRHQLASRIARRHRLELLDKGWPMPLLGLDCFVMQVPADMAIGAAIDEVSRDPRVAWSEPMQIYRTESAPVRRRDPLLPLQPAETIWHLDDLHRLATGRGVIVAVIDSKIETGHPDLSGQFVAEQDFVGGQPAASERHGTAVAGVIAAKADNGLGIVGIAPAARLMALRACRQMGSTASSPTICNSLGLAQAIQFAILHHAKVINLSLAGPGDRLLDRLLDVALVRDITVVAAYDPLLPEGGFPASKAGVIAVTNESLSRLRAGVYGAPGNDVPTTEPGGKWYLVDGSSFAAAHVSGLIALVREEHIRSARTALAVAPGTGMVDACATLVRARECNCTCAGGERAISSLR